MTMTDQTFKKSFIGAALGTMIEYYDFSLFMAFLPILSPVFFPGETAYQALSYGYVILFFSLLVRPFGGIAFGYLGDFMGRRKALLLSMYGIALATFALGFTPSYAAIGSWAIALVILSKAVQGFCFAGEFNGAGIYVVEHANNKREALAGSLLTSVMICGSLLAAIIGVILTLPGMPIWSWRIAFVIGGFLGLFGILYRKNMIETPNFRPANADKHSFLQLIKDYPREVIAGICIGALATVPYTTVIAFVCPVLVAKGFINSHQLMILQCGIAVYSIFALLIAGYIADKTSIPKTMLVGALGLILLPYPLLMAVDQHISWLLLPALTTIVICNEIFLAPSNAYLKNIFPMHYRYRGSSFSFSTGMSIIGGATPLIERYLYNRTGAFSSIALWLGFVSVCALLSIYMVEHLPERSALYAPDTQSCD